jgi:hypothetical protein
VSPSRKNISIIRGQRGHATIVAIALSLALLVFVAAIVRMVMAQFAVTKSERDSEHALQLAEAGANAYINMLTHGVPPNTATNSGLIPPAFTPPPDVLAQWPNGVMPISTFLAEVQNTASISVPHGNLTYYPPGQTKQCYFAYQTQAITGAAGGSVVAFGWSNGVVRRVKVDGQMRGLFDVFAVYGLNPADAIDLNNVNITGGWGSEGAIDTNRATTVTGPTYLAAAGAAANPPPTGWPNVTYSSRSLGVPTADQAANQWAYARDSVATTLGVEYFRTHNNNTTNIKYLVQDKTTHVVRELPGDATWAASATPGAAVTFSTSNSPPGKTGNETVYGIRFYPGDYYFTNLQPNVTLYGRNYAEGGQPASDPVKAFITPDPINPVNGLAARTDIRIWVGSTASGTSTNLDTNIICEDSRYPDRFRLYDANTSGLVLGPANLSISILAYNTDSRGAGYGSVNIQNPSAITGSVIGWSVDGGGGDGGDGDGDHRFITIQKGTLDPGNSDGFLFSTTNWKELP